MLLLEQIEQRVQERADREFARFLAELELAQIAKHTDAVEDDRRRRAKQVEMMFRASSLPSIYRLKDCCEHRRGTYVYAEFFRSVDRYKDLLIDIGMMPDGGGGYHKLHAMSIDQLDRIAHDLHQIEPVLIHYYRAFS